MAGKITALVVQKRNKERVNVFIDGEFAFGLAMIEALKLHRGQDLSDKDIARLQVLDSIEVAHERALKFLSYRPRSVEEVRRKLRQTDIDETTIEAVIERLERSGLLDDEMFARFWVENREQFSPRGTRALRYELRQKGVPDEIIQETIADLDEGDTAYHAALKRLGRYAQADEQTFRKRLGDYLIRRGFAYHTVRDVLDRLWIEYGSQADTSGYADTD